MPAPTHPFLRHHLPGLLGILAGAALTEATGSVLPLALGSSFALMATFRFVQVLRRRAQARRAESRFHRPDQRD